MTDIIDLSPLDSHRLSPVVNTTVYHQPIQRHYYSREIYHFLCHHLSTPQFLNQNGPYKSFYFSKTSTHI
jgi:hypothetical protein